MIYSHWFWNRTFFCCRLFICNSINVWYKQQGLPDIWSIYWYEYLHTAEEGIFTDLSHLKNYIKIKLQQDVFVVTSFLFPLTICWHLVMAKNVPTLPYKRVCSYLETIICSYNHQINHILRWLWLISITYER